jgi:ABC-type transporter Mla MlaB component
VVFSFFAKKQPAKPAARPAPPAARKPAAVPAPAAPLTEAGEDLDFTNFEPAREAAVGPAAALEPSRDGAMQPFLPTSAMSIPLPDWIEAPANPEPPEVAPAPRSGGPPRPPDSILSIEVESGAGEVPAAIEETAILFANGQAQEALGRIGEALGGDGLSGWELQAWLMRFDLYQHLGLRAEFEEKALDFVVRFERSPPAWADAPPPAATPTVMRTGGAGHVALTGGLTAASAAAIEHLRRMQEKQPRLRLDVGRLNGIDGAGAQLLLDTLKTSRKAGKDLYFTGEAELLRLIQAQAPSGDRNADPALWMLALEIAQQLGDEQRYEDLALEYTITYEVSPPAWETVAPRTTPRDGPTAETGAGTADAFVVEGDVIGPTERVLSELQAFAAQADPVVIDLERTRRVDFVSAGQLLNLLAQLKQSGKSIEIRGANQLILALFAMMGIRELARLVPRK